MSCWVVPAIAADLWGVPIKHVLGQIEEGSIPTKIEHGFVLVEVAPPGDRFRPLPRPRVRRPVDTFTVVTEEELDALHPDAPKDDWTDAESDSLDRDSIRLDAPSFAWGNDGPVDDVPLVAEEQAAFAEPVATREELPPPGPESTHDEELGPPGDPDPDADHHEPEPGPPLDWRATRARVGRTRRPPGGEVEFRG